ncbi:hypothetical protein [Acuticoccus yangtzensis]|nr:hypothetical protein [Acuticoccus yangtzensis]
MRAMLLSFVTIAAIAVGAYYTLHSEVVPWTTADRTSASSVRLD